MEEAFEVQGEEVLDDDFLWVGDYYPRVVSLDKKDADHSVNIVARTSHPGRSRTGHHDICTVPLPSGVD